MSTVPPRIGRDVRRGAPSGIKQGIFLVCGVGAAGLLGVSVPRIGGEPIWLVGMLPAMWTVGIGLIVVSAWRMKTAVLEAERTVVGPVEFLAAGCASAGGVLWFSGGTQLIGVVSGVLLGVAVGLVALMVAGFLNRSRRRGVAARVRAAAVSARGVVTSTGLQDFPATPNPKVATLTVVFTDHVGTRRWLTPTALQVPANPIGMDDEVVVWFDPEDPGDVGRIVVEFDNGVSRILRTN
ncbi:hypothetical protein [Nocardia sp. NBC_00511]|uniref:hypothetical protein n=1 Tax=Nocardia sp. NBC_00511 TaxID=2903591 RepID=UPI0030DFC234